MSKDEKVNNWPSFIPEQTMRCPKCKITYPKAGAGTYNTRCGQCGTRLEPLEKEACIGSHR